MALGAPGVEITSRMLEILDCRLLTESCHTAYTIVIPNSLACGRERDLTARLLHHRRNRGEDNRAGVRIRRGHTADQAETDVRPLSCSLSECRVRDDNRRSIHER